MELGGPSPDTLAPEPHGPSDLGRAAGAAPADPADETDGGSLADLAARLVADPGELAAAVAGLEALDAETRARIIEELATVADDPAVARLLGRLLASGDAETRDAARSVVGRAGLPALYEESRAGVPGAIGARPRLVRSAVTAVDGDGRGSIAVSAQHAGERRSAVFLCDLSRGVVDVVGRVEEESPRAGSLLDEVREHAGVLALEDVPDLALGLLAGALMLDGTDVPGPVREWLARTLGGVEARPLMLPSGPPGGVVAPEELERHAGAVLDACPTWLDASPLTFELAEEIALREGRVPADPGRDSGAFRYLFEHRVIHRLELYRRMLLWMAGFWDAAGEGELARSAGVLAGQLADRQFAVPSHPFAVALAARSLGAAQGRLGTEADPRPARRGRGRRES